MSFTDPLLRQTRRHFFRDCRVGLGTMALASYLGNEARAAEAGRRSALEKLHHAAKAKAVIYLFMAGGPSQFELFEPKAALQKYHGQPAPDSFLKGKRFAFM